MTKHKKAAALPVHLAANIENAADLIYAKRNYFPTEQSYLFVNRLADSTLQGGSALSLQGAYGAGKSSLGIFSLHQLACNTKVFTPQRKIAQAGRLSGTVKRIQASGGMFAVPIVGAHAPLAQRIAYGLRKASICYAGRRTKVLLGLDSENAVAKASNDTILRTLDSLMEDLQDAYSAGLLLLIDEFGRQFEHIIDTGSVQDLHLLQALAERPGTSKVPFSTVIIQHHSIGHYASRLMSAQQAEWDKVKGRFEEFNLSNSEVDTANIISTLLSTQGSKATRHATRFPAARDIEKTVKPLGPAFLTAARKCYPLHPMTVVILSRLSRLLGQGDRTVVGWLTSSLNSGFQAAQELSNDWVYPDALFDHFFGDIQYLPANLALAKRFSAVHGSNNRLGLDSRDFASRVLKTVGLLFFCSGSGLTASKTALRSCLSDSKMLEKTLEDLESKSLIVYRRHTHDYRVWEGSDYDIREKIGNKIKGKAYSPAAALNSYYPVRILAHRHYIETGNHRTAPLKWLDNGQLLDADDAATQPQIAVWLDSAPSQRALSRDKFVWGVFNSKGMSDFLQEACALRDLLESDAELQSDSVALAEVKSQLAYLHAKIENHVLAEINSGIAWSYGRKKCATLQEAVSQMMNTAYERTLTIHNELINRQRVSGPGTLAVRLLLEAMVHRSDQPNLGIEKFPAERLIYESMLKKLQLHGKDKAGKWRLTISPAKGDPHLADIFQSISKMAQTGSAGAPSSIASILDALAQPPYGLHAIPCSILVCTYLIVLRDEVELYEDGRFLANWSVQTLVRMTKAPDSFSIHISTGKQYSAQFLAGYMRAVAGTDARGTSITTLSLAKAVLVRYSKLAGYAKNTLEVSKRAQEFRKALHAASSPVDMLFQAFPKVFGLKGLLETSSQHKQLFRNISSVFSELEQAPANLLKSFEGILLEIYSCSSMSAARRKTVDDVHLITSRSRMLQGNEAFMKAVLSKDAAEDSAWLRKVLDMGLDIRVPIDDWNDHEASQAEYAFRHKLIGFRQAALMLGKKKLSASGTMPVIMLGGSLKSANKGLVRRVDRTLQSLPKEEVVPVLLALLSQRSEPVK